MNTPAIVKVVFYPPNPNSFPHGFVQVRVLAPGAETSFNMYDSCCPSDEDTQDYRANLTNLRESLTDGIARVDEALKALPGLEEQREAVGC